MRTTRMGPNLTAAVPRVLELCLVHLNPKWMMVAERETIVIVRAQRVVVAAAAVAMDLATFRVIAARAA